MATPQGDSYGVVSGGVIAAGRSYLSPFWRDLATGWTEITPSGVRPPFGILGFSGSAWDSASGKLYINGGGHADYGGNEVWEWDYENRATNFVRHYEPDFASIYGVGTPEQQYAALAPFVDNVNYPGAVMSGGLPVRPISRHTYSSLVWLPWLGKFTVGGASTYSGMAPVDYWGNVWPNSPKDFWLYDPTAKKFEYKGSGLLNSAYDPITRFSLHATRRKLYGIGINTTNEPIVYEYDTATNIWSIHPNAGPSLSVVGVQLAVDSTRDRLVCILQSSTNQFYTYAYDLPTGAWSEIVTTGTRPSSL